MEFHCSAERFELMGPPRPSRLARPPAPGTCSKDENPNFAEFEQEQRSLAMHYTPTGSNLFEGTADEMEEGIPANDSRQVQEFAPSQTGSSGPADKRRLDAVNNVNDVNNGKTGKRRRPHSKTLKHSDARLPEVST